MLFDGLKAQKPRFGALGRRIGSFAERAVDVRIVIRVSDRHVEDRNALFVHFFDQAVGFGKIKISFLVGAEAVGLGNHVRDAEPCRKKHVLRERLFHGAKAVEIKARAVFKASAVASRAIKRREKLLQKIAVTGFYVHPVKARLRGKKRRFFVKRGKGVEIFVGHDRPVGNGAFFLVDRMTVDDHRMNALPSRMRKL